MLNIYIFLIFAQSIGYEYTLDPPRWKWNRVKMRVYAHHLHFKQKGPVPSVWKYDSN